MSYSVRVSNIDYAIINDHLTELIMWSIDAAQLNVTYLHSGKIQSIPTPTHNYGELRCV